MTSREQGKAGGSNRDLKANRASWILLLAPSSLSARTDGAVDMQRPWGCLEAPISNNFFFPPLELMGVDGSHSQPK